jgi:molecular chaperone GrpE
MKKKMQEKEESMHESQKGTIDSKEYTEDNKTYDNPGGKTGDNASGSNEKESELEAAADKVVSEVRVVEEKLAEMQDKYIRLSAEFDNYRKRTLREKMDLSKYAEESLLLKLIPFMDDFERALMHIEKSEENVALKNGVDLIYIKFSEFLKQNGVTEIEALNNSFDVDLHEAVAKVPVDDEKMKGKVVDVALKGYYLRDKVLRFAKVVVGE